MTSTDRFSPTQLLGFKDLCFNSRCNAIKIPTDLDLNPINFVTEEIQRGLAHGLTDPMPEARWSCIRSRTTFTDIPPLISSRIKAQTF